MGASGEQSPEATRPAKPADPAKPAGCDHWLAVSVGWSLRARQFVASTVVNRIVFVPAVLLPLALAGVFPHLMVTFAILDVVLAIGAWVLRSRET